MDMNCRAWRVVTAARLCRWLLALCLAAIPLTSSAGVFISVNFAPPPLPVYAQPLIPGPGYIWAPGYWAYADGGYFWVPGTWVLPPYAGALWTPGYWGWRGGTFFYNRSVNNIRTTTITHVYNRTVINDTTINRISYNGGMGGVRARPTEEQQLAAREPHVAPTQAQLRQARAASQQRSLRATFNHGTPAIAATRRPGVFEGRGVMRARPAEGYAARRTPYTHPRPQDARPYARSRLAQDRAYGSPPRVTHVNPGGPMRRAPPPRRHEPNPHCCGGLRAR